MPILMSEDFPLACFAETVGQASWPDDTLVMAFTPVSWRFDAAPVDAAFIASTVEGRIFSPAGELRWRMVDGRCRAVFLGEGPAPLPMGDHSSQLEGLTPRLDTLILWGVRTGLEDEWLEQQVPQRFAYPVATKAHQRGRVAVVVELWEDDAGIAHFSRYHSIKEISGENHATGS